jgi:hypothetical protein
MMKNMIFITFLVVQGLLINAQVIKNPDISACSDSAMNVQIDQIELTEENTIITFTVRQPKGSMIFIPSDSYIIPSEGGEKLFIQRATGITINQAVKKSGKGKLSFKLIFPGIEKTIKKINYRGGNEGNNWHFFEINIDQGSNDEQSSIISPEKGFIIKDGKQWKYIDNPKYTAKSSKNFRISRVELTDNETVLYFEFTGMPGNWIYIPSESYIQPSDGGEVLYLKSAEGTRLNEETWSGNTGVMSYKLFFPKIDENVKKINFKELYKNGNWSVFELDISTD